MEIEEISVELQRIKQEIFRHKVHNFRIAEHLSPFKGSGYEIHSINQWSLGDPMDGIDYQLSLPSWPRKIFRIDRVETKFAPCVLVADISPSVFIQIEGAVGKFKLLLHSIGALGLAANYFQDLVAVLCVSDAVEFYLPPKFGTGQIFHSMRLIIEKAEEFETLKKKNKLIRKKSDLNKALEFLAGRLSQQCSIVLLSDFVDVIGGEYEIDFQLLELLAAKHNWNVLAIFLDDPDEFAWPRSNGTVSIRNTETGTVEIVRADRAAKIRQAFLENRERLRNKLRDSGVDSTVLHFGDHFNDLAQFLSQRK